MLFWQGQEALVSTIVKPPVEESSRSSIVDSHCLAVQPFQGNSLPEGGNGRGLHLLHASTLLKHFCPFREAGRQSQHRLPPEGGKQSDLPQTDSLDSNAHNDIVGQA